MRRGERGGVGGVGDGRGRGWGEVVGSWGGVSLEEEGGGPVWGRDFFVSVLGLGGKRVFSCGWAFTFS